MRVMMALGNIEQTLHAMNERLSKLETKMNSAMNHDHRRSIRFGQHVSLGPSRSHRVPVSPSVRRDSNLLTPEDMLNDSMVMVRLEADELSPRNHPSVSGQLGPKIGSGNGSGRNLPKTSIKTSSSYSPKSAEVTTPQALLEPEGSIAAVSLPISDIGSSMKSNGKHVSSSSIQSFHELVAMTRVKRQLKTKNRMPAVDEHSTLDHPSISPSFAATSLHQSSGANDEGLESSMSTFSAPQAQQLSLTRAQSFQQESELDDEAMIQNATLPRSSLVTKSVNWLQQKLPHLSTSNSHTQSQLSGQIPSEIRNLRAAAKHSAYDIRLQMFNVQIRRAASGVEKLAILTWWQYPWIVFKWIFWDMLDPTRHGTREVRIVWDFVMIMAMLYILFATPLIIGFNINTVRQNASIDDMLLSHTLPSLLAAWGIYKSLCRI